MTVAAVAALIGWALRARWEGDRVTFWDIAGAFFFIGCAAAVLSQPENVLQLFGVSAAPEFNLPGRAPLAAVGCDVGLDTSRGVACA
jgi:hypothetical protein